MYKFLEWDTDFFGFSIASISADGFTAAYIEPLLTSMKIQGIRLAYCFLPPGELEKNKLAVRYGGFLADEKITYKKSVSASPDRIADPSVVSYKGPMTVALADLAIQSGHKSRFRVDPNFPAGSADRLYTRWIENSLNGQLADEVLVYELNHELVGMITLSVKEKTGNIGLLGVDSRHRGKKIGQKLVDASEISFSAKGIKQLEVVTQKANTEACRFYEKVGFAVAEVMNVYHFWIK